VSHVYLHVGPVKTGSTYLQKLLWTNRQLLARQGLLYPCEHANEMWFAVNDIQGGAFIHFDLPEAEGAWRRVRDRALAFDGRSILSHEVIGLSTVDHVARIADSLRPATLHVIVMARALAALLPSVWQEKVKMVDPDIAWPQYLEEQRQSGAPWADASLVVDRWLKHVDASRIHVVTVPPRGIDGRVLLNRFADAVGVDVTGWEGTADIANESLDVVQVELIRRLNQVTSEFLDIYAQRRLLSVVVPLLGLPDPDRRRRLPATARDWVELETARRIDRLRDSGAVIHGTLDDLTAPEDAWETEHTEVAATEMLDEALRLLAASHPDRG
jgi:hypothetical protein